mmetsp:Transcript_30477/g.45372  ORF Transcript_30477/g.45372 Transcript_30477/m.45372 type:complete len:114 (+) Transcript_30477:103-444(+)
MNNYLRTALFYTAILYLLSLATTTEAFSTPHLVNKHTFLASGTSSSSLNLKKKGTPAAGTKKAELQKDEDYKPPSGLDLFFLFMNPLRNPNSIFVYMILIINILAKVKENTPE